nr:HAMP domain-containing protein [Lachnospiraceae bacterium]
MNLIKRTWLKLPIEQKTRSYAMVLIIIIALAGIFNMYVVNDSLQGMGVVLDDLTRCENVFTALEEQKSALDKVMRSDTSENRSQYESACLHTRAMIARLPFQYENVGAERYARTWRIISAYEVYETKCDEVIESLGEGESRSSDAFYKLLEMQGYLDGYMQDLIQITVEVGAVAYQGKVPLLNALPYLLLFFSVFAIIVTGIFSGVFSSTLTRPIRRLAESVRKISDDDFGGEDVQVENRDEIGELVTSFNQMKHAVQE